MYMQQRPKTHWAKLIENRQSQKNGRDFNIQLSVMGIKVKGKQGNKDKNIKN
jgi:hypothetical protein